MNKLLLFDVDGTLAESTKEITPKMLSKLVDLKNAGYDLGLVGGGNYQKISQQIKNNNHLFKYIFSENGIVSYENGKLIHENSIKKVYKEDVLQLIINILLHYTANLSVPYKRGHFIAFRNAMLYYTPIGSDCSQEEREEFAKYDEIHHIRRQIMNDLKKILPENLKLDIKLGGQIGIGIHPIGWDKRYCLKFIPEIYDQILFYGDRCDIDENDYPLYSHERVVGHKVKSPDDTQKYLNEL